MSEALITVLLVGKRILQQYEMKSRGQEPPYRFPFSSNTCKATRAQLHNLQSVWEEKLSTEIFSVTVLIYLILLKWWPKNRFKGWPGRIWCNQIFFWHLYFQNREMVIPGHRPAWRPWWGAGPVIRHFPHAHSEPGSHGSDRSACLASGSATSPLAQWSSGPPLLLALEEPQELWIAKQKLMSE